MGNLDRSTSAASPSGAESHIGFEDVLVMGLAGSAVAGHLAFLGALSVKAFWLLSLSTSLLGAYLLIARTAGNRAAAPARRDRTSWLAILAGVVLTLCLHRPDVDDRTYLAQELRALDHPEASYRSMAAVPAYNAGYVLSPYEYLRAGFSWLTGIPLLVCYYLVWPSVLAAMTVAYQSRLLKLLGVESLSVALLMWFVVMLAWGDTHRTPPNFGFVRMFQGKSAVVWVTIPAAQYYWLRFVEFGERRALLLMNAAIIAGIGFSPTGVPAGVLLVGLFTAATAILHGASGGHGKALAAVSRAGIYPIVIGLLLRFYFGHTPQSGILPEELLSEVPAVSVPAAPVVIAPLPGPTKAPSPAPLPMTAVSRVDLRLALGTGTRSITAIACLVALPILLRRARVGRLFSVYTILCTLLLAFPWSSELLGTYAFSSFAWRWLYVIPLVLSVALAVERIALWFERPLARWAVAALLAIAFLSGPSLRVLSEENHTHLTVPVFKLKSLREVELAGFDRPATIDGLRLISPSTGARY